MAVFPVRVSAHRVAVFPVRVSARKVAVFPVSVQGVGTSGGGVPCQGVGWRCSLWVLQGELARYEHVESETGWMSRS